MIKDSVKNIYDKASEFLFKRLGSTTGPAVAVMLGVFPFLLLTSLPFVYLAGKKHPSSFTVMITNHIGNSGGSGSVVETSSSESKILTNAHVCKGVLKRGGKVRKVDGTEHIVTGYYLSDEHDLCMVVVAADLGTVAEIADRAPLLYDNATITGHPALMPNVISKGLFGGRQIIEIITEMRPCSAEDLANPEIGALCIFIGGVPTIRLYESMVVSATIMRGSSGSAVLNDDGNISGVVFAGNAEGLSYAFTVPYEAVRNFLSLEMRLKQLSQKERPWELPSSELNRQEQQNKQKKDGIRKLRVACSDPNIRFEIGKFCRLAFVDTLD